jgi:hypothetical protein
MNRKPTDAPKEVTIMAKAETKTYTPKDLAEELEVDGKRIRSYLRSNFGRDAEDKNTSWVLTEAMAQSVRDHFEDSEDEDES